MYAIALPEEQIVSVIPKCDMGHIAHALWRIKNMFILTFFFILMFASMCLIKSVSESGWGNVHFWSEYSLFMLITVGFSLFFCGLIAYSAYKACAPTRCKLAEEIFYLLGMKNIARADLNKITKEREQQLMDQGMWYDPDDQSRPVCPTQKFVYSAESWFYY
ncbi:hypothetical protein MUU49_11380 [Scandinavium goeteborgense]|uniref:hypothetical protein n=1 Tax=Scandinavium goeteborgense TaxID=1851514 RepID=UPI002165BD0B|nr:hypothetical protein [Scandinavium goeteborgense]MCS2153167.1 hypothetical protein [Scandinavium goeteborgense]